MTEILALFRKELLQAFRNPQMLFLIIAAPMIQIVVLGYAAQLEFRRADTVVVDEDRSPASRDFVDGLGADRTFQLRAVPDVAAAMEAVRAGDAQVALIVPRGFARDRAAGRTVAVQVLYDGSDTTRGLAASSAIEAYAASRLRAPPARPGGRVALEPRLLYNPGLDSQHFFVPGTGASLLVIITMLITAMGLAREREVGTLEQLLVTPISPITLMVGKMLPYALFGIVDEALMLLIGNLIFGVPLAGSLLVLFIAACGYLMCTLALGLLIAASARTQQQVFMSGFFFMLPAILLSGFMTPIEAMPRWIQPLTIINPMRHFIEASRSILLRSADFDDVVRPITSLFVIGSLLLLFAVLRFRRKLG